MLEQINAQAQYPPVGLVGSNQPESSLEQILLVLAKHFKKVHGLGGSAHPYISIQRGEVHGILQSRPIYAMGLPFSGLGAGETTLGEVRVPRAPQERIALQFGGSRIELTPEILSFCRQQGVLQYLQTACEMIESCFSSVEELSVQLEEDPDTGEEWLVLGITIQGEVEKILDQYQSYTYQWVSKAPWPERNKIRLSYNII